MEATLDVIMHCFNLSPSAALSEAQSSGSSNSSADVMELAFQAAVKDMRFLHDDLDVVIATLAVGRFHPESVSSSASSTGSLLTSASPSKAAMKSGGGHHHSRNPVAQLMHSLSGSSAAASPARAATLLNSSAAAAMSSSVSAVTSASSGQMISQEEQLSTACTTLSDDLLYHVICPSLDAVFLPRQMHRRVLQQCYALASAGAFHLTQADMLGSLRSLASLADEEVRSAVTSGIDRMLQQEDDRLTPDGWTALLDILTMPALSVSRQQDMVVSTSTYLTDDDNEVSGSIKAGVPWTHESLAKAFSCVKLTSDDFLDRLDLNATLRLIDSLFVFSIQDSDINISLTAVEIMWKVTDSFARAVGTREAAKVGNADPKKMVFDAMLERLMALSVDSRPEIRNCAMKTLFAAMVSHASQLSPPQWRSVFSDVIFPLFGLAAHRSDDARRSHAKAFAPELKKGVTMTVHHSRDTAHKQVNISHF